MKSANENISETCPNSHLKARQSNPVIKLVSTATGYPELNGLKQLGIDEVYLGPLGFCRRGAADFFSPPIQLEISPLSYPRLILNLNIPLTRSKLTGLIQRLNQQPGLMNLFKGVLINQSGAVRLVKSCFPEVHLSVGSMPLNLREVEFFRQLGVSRLVFSSVRQDLIMSVAAAATAAAAAGIEPLEIEVMVQDHCQKSELKINNGRCYITAYHRGNSSKRSGVCHQGCCRSDSDSVLQPDNRNAELDKLADLIHRGIKIFKIPQPFNNQGSKFLEFFHSLQYDVSALKGTKGEFL